MDIWIIRDGEKVGPIHDFEARRSIESGELSATTLAWHEGLPSWKPLAEIDLFSREFELIKRTSEPAEESPPAENPPPPPLPRQVFYLRRFCARWLDLFLYSGLWWLGMWGAGQDIEGTLLNPWIMFLRYIPWFVIEILLLQHFGTTPGKWLLGLRVTNQDGSLMNLAESTQRATRVMFTGVGFGWELLAVFCQALSVFTASRLGNTLWDHAGGHQVTATPLVPARMLALICLFVGSVILQTLVVSPHTYRIWIRQVPAMKEMVPENPLWQLPERGSKR
jgi:uncharacterized RDD family membrane protein YckC